MPGYGLRYLIVWYAIILHLLQGALLVIDDTAGYVTSTAHVREWLSLSADMLGAIYIAIGLLAAWGLWRLPRLSIARLACVIPQQFFLVLAAAGAGLAIWDSQFADDVVRSRYFIGADQCPIIIATVLHSFALLDARIEAAWALWRYGRN